MREVLEFRYSATDIYIVCLMHCNKADQEINIIDKREVIEAKWIPLVDLSSNDEKTAKYRMFPNAYKFIKLVYAHFMTNKNRIEAFSDPCLTGKSTATEIMKQVGMTHEEVAPTSGKGKPWSYYISEALKCSL